MNRETEIKLKVDNLEGVKKEIELLPATVHLARHFEENMVFDTPELLLRNTGKLLRLRVTQNPDEAILTYKGQQKITDGLKDREEIETTIGSPKHIQSILERLHYSIQFRYQKFRTIYNYGKLHICIDETPIGNYLELEGDPEQVHICAEKLGYTRDQYITLSYGSLYFAWCKEQGIEPSHMVF